MDSMHRIEDEQVHLNGAAHERDSVVCRAIELRDQPKLFQIGRGIVGHDGSARSENEK